MLNLHLYKDKYQREFAECMVDKFKLDQYGIQCSKSAIDCDTAFLRHELVSWYENEDSDALTQVSLAYMSWLPITYDGCPAPYVGSMTTAGQTCSGAPVIPCTHTLGMDYVSGNTSANIIDINVGGCFTRIDVNPNITINGGSYQYYIPTADDVWVIYHNLGYIPNVLITDLSGDEISGVITEATISKIEITFSNPVAGYAYLS